MDNPFRNSLPGSHKRAKELLDMYFLDMRCALLETSAALDRIERAEGGAEIGSDPRIRKLKEACDVIKNGGGDRGERILVLFSEPS